MPTTWPMFSLMKGGSGDDRSFALQKRVFRFLLHCVLATVVSFVIGFFVFSLIHVSDSHGNWLLLFLLGSQYSPAFWGVGFLLGLTVNLYMRDRSASWVGVLAILFLVFSLGYDFWALKTHQYFPSGYNEGQYWIYEYDQLFAVAGEKGCGASECLGRLMITVPILTSVSYSIGARLALGHRTAAA